MRYAALLLGTILAASRAVAAPAWTPQAWVGEDTLELTTVGAEEGEHTFPVWLVVLDGEVYVRLGTKAAGRVEKSTTAPYVGVTIGGQRFPRVKVVPAPDRADAVATAIRDKYWSEVLIQYFSHPLTARLVPE